MPARRALRIARVATLVCLAVGLPARGSALELRSQKLQLAGAPATLFTVDLDRDGRNDLVVVLASTNWESVGRDEPLQIDETGAYVDVLTVVPTLFDRRTLAVHLGSSSGGFSDVPLTLELPEQVHALLPGPSATPLLAWTDGGISTVEIDGGTLVLAPRISARAIVAGGSGFLSQLPMTVDLDDDGERDLLLPVNGGIEIHLAIERSISLAAASTVPYELDERLPGDARHYRSGTRRLVPLPEAIDLDGDRMPELVYREHERGWNRMRVLRNLGGGRFSAPIDPLAGRARDADPAVVWIGDLDGDGRGDVVTQEELSKDDASMREELAEARAPRARYRVHSLDANLVWSAEPTRTFELIGHVFGGGEEIGLPEGIGDLDGDGKVDFVGLELEFSLLQMLRIVAARSIGIGLDFRPYCQTSSGSFRETPGQDLGGRFTLKLDRLRVGRISSFAGDFDGDGRSDFLQLGRGREVTIRFGSEGCRFPEAGAAKIKLQREPANLALVRVLDLDGDGRSDLAVTHPPEKGAIGGRGTLELHLSGWSEK